VTVNACWVGEATTMSVFVFGTRFGTRFGADLQTDYASLPA
jgi:hypothetical protein